jgi:hypothetical protein
MRRNVNPRSFRPKKQTQRPEIPGEVYDQELGVPVSEDEYRRLESLVLRMRRERLAAYNAERLARGEPPITGYENIE